MCNTEIDTAAAVAQETSWSTGPHDVVAFILFAACLTIGIIQLISFIYSIVKKEWDWDKQPVPSKISLIARGVLGWTIAIYIIGLLIWWSSWSWTIVYMTFVSSIFIGFGIPFIAAMLFFFGHHFLYKPLAGILSGFKKK